jgi:hypothetical protein
MLFGVDANGIPSVAEWVHLGAAPAAARAAKDAPSAHVHDFAGDLAKSPKKNGKKRASAPVGPKVAGCDRHYGSANVCVPLTFPAPVKATTRSRCDWLTAHGYARLKVNGRDDPLRLDPDRDGRTCGKGDLRR